MEYALKQLQLFGRKSGKTVKKILANKEEK